MKRAVQRKIWLLGLMVAALACMAGPGTAHADAALTQAHRARMNQLGIQPAPRARPKFTLASLPQGKSLADVTLPSITEFPGFQYDMAAYYCGQQVMPSTGMTPSQILYSGAFRLTDSREQAVQSCMKQRGFNFDVPQEPSIGNDHQLDTTPEELHQSAENLRETQEGALKSGANTSLVNVDQLMANTPWMVSAHRAFTAQAAQSVDGRTATLKGLAVPDLGQSKLLASLNLRIPTTAMTPHSPPPFAPAASHAPARSNHTAAVTPPPPAPEPVSGNIPDDNPHVFTGADGSGDAEPIFLPH